MYQSTIFGTSVRPRAPPNAEPFQSRPVTSWNGRVLISWPAAGDADDERLAPALVRAFERLTHHVTLPMHSKRIVGAAIGQLHDRWTTVLPTSFGIDEVRHAEFCASRGAPG